MTIRFSDRREAGRRLAQAMASDLATDPPGVVLALPRGGVPIGYEIARALDAPLDVFVVRKLGAPGQEELAMGAIASGGFRTLNASVINGLAIAPETVEAVTRREQAKLARLEQAYRGDRPFPPLQGRVVVLVDDGLATGASMRVAIQALRPMQPAQIIIAIPTAPAETIWAMRNEADRIYYLVTPDPFAGVGASYTDFSQLSDGDVKSTLELHTMEYAAQRKKDSAAGLEDSDGTPRSQP